MKNLLPVWLNWGSTEKTNDSAISSLAPKILTAKDDINGINPYLNILKRVIDTKGITNIALTGRYGSGKSTILKTFQFLNPDNKYLNISLASFKDVKQTKDNNNGEDENKIFEQNENLERRIEISILQQIFYHVKPSEIPDSRFKRIENIGFWKIFFIALGLIFWVGSAIILFKHQYINKLNPDNWDKNHNSDVPAICLLIIFFLGIGFLTKTVVKLFINSKINKLNIKGELEIGEGSNKSVFNEHLEEILYFFERTDYNVITIEDLDRFDRTDIFTKLREINILLNTSKAINREINFIYAVRDEIFKDKSERVKFFEYIIPVIPFINPSNAGDQMTRLISEAKLENVLSKEFTEDVVTFIDDIDMRLLTNIFHEYQLYKQSLNDDLEQDNLFAMITYKNLFPEDFGNLHKREGILYQFLTNKANYIAHLINEINDQIKEKENLIVAINNEKAPSIRELRSVYINEITAKLPNLHSFNFGSQIVSLVDVLKDEHFLKLLKNEPINYYGFQNQYSTQYILTDNIPSTLKFSEIEKIINSEKTYLEREKLVAAFTTKKTEALRLEIEKLKSRKNDIEGWSLKRIFEDIDIDLYLVGLFSNNNLMRNLLLNGYINENYNDYISLFHAVNLTQSDYAFERKVKGGVSSPFDYELYRIDNLTKKIPSKYYTRECILNFDMLDYLAESYDENYEKYDSVINLLSNEKPKSIEFIDLYIIHSERNLNLFINVLSKHWADFWDFIETKSNYTIDKKKDYLKLILRYSDIDDILILSANHKLPNFINKLSDFIDIAVSVSDDDKISDLLLRLNIQLETLQKPNSESARIFNFIRTNNLYEINFQNILIVLNLDEIVTESDLSDSCYTAIRDSNDEILHTYILKNINLFVKNVLLKLDGNNLESIDSIIEILNNKELNEEVKLDWVKHQEFLINDLSLIQEIKVKQILLQELKVSATWDNVFNYYSSSSLNEIDDSLSIFLNYDSHYYSLSNSNIEGSARSEIFVKGFAETFLTSPVLEFNSFIEIAMGFPKNLKSWNGLDVSSLDNDIVEWLIDNKFLNLTIDNYNILKEHFEKFHVKLLEKFPSTFISQFDKFPVEEEDITNLLESDEFPKSYKLKLLQKLDNEIIIDSEVISEAASKILVKSTAVDIDNDIIENIIECAPTLEIKIRLITLYFERFELDDIKSIIENFGDDYQDIFIRQHKPIFIKTDYHKELFEKLRLVKMIIRYEINKNNPNYFRVYANY